MNALIKSIISKTHLLHYGSEFLPFLEQLPERRDTDAAWALRTETLDNDSEEYTPDEDDEDERTISALGSRPLQPVTKRTKSEPATSVPRERKASLPPGRSSTTGSQSQDLPPRQLLRDLQAISRDLEKIDSLEVAQEITRNGVKLFLAIQVCGVVVLPGILLLIQISLGTGYTILLLAQNQTARRTTRLTTPRYRFSTRWQIILLAGA